jgi:hypothetical protein
MWLGVVAALLGATGLCVVQLAEDAHFKPRISDWLSVWRMPWYLVQGTWEILMVLVRDLSGGERAKSLFRLAEFDAGPEKDQVATGRRTLAVGYTTMAPNFIVFGINPQYGMMLFHQIEESGIPKMTQDLGARQ